MEIPNSSAVLITIAVPAFVIIALWALGVANWVWLRPRRIEKCLREQGFKGNPYRIFYGDTKEMKIMGMNAISKPINLSDDIRPRVLPFHHHTIIKYGKKSFTWNGPIPKLNIMDPDLIKDILLKNYVFKKARPNPLALLLVSGISFYEDEKWTKHRRIINPAFHMDKLKSMLPAMHLCCSELIEKWEMMVSEKSSCELDVQPYLENLTSDVISRTAFGSSYEEGRRIFQLQKEQAALTRLVLNLVYIPGWR
ncbi:hypothetical protein Vadar_011427 [Vaccinium darrowii]|uniref:Uncharacterized protein n=1 Tax=Vaccinium darrowii TaxID=229202 RepID=A0ACB7Z3J9_9ERIC|nr:hypothetical protein Vadar_011427 [Vaccinium darrowii]